MGSSPGGPWLAPTEPALCFFPCNTSRFQRRSLGRCFEGGSERVNFPDWKAGPGRAVTWGRAGGRGPGGRGRAAHLPRPSCTHRRGSPRTAAPGTPCGGGGAKETSQAAAGALREHPQGGPAGQRGQAHPGHLRATRRRRPATGGEPPAQRAWCFPASRLRAAPATSQMRLGSRSRAGVNHEKEARSPGIEASI